MYLSPSHEEIWREYLWQSQGLEAFSRTTKIRIFLGSMAHLSQECIQSLYDEFGELKVLDDIIRHRAADDVQVPILGYPRFEDSVDDYELFTGKQLDRFIDLAIEKLVSSGLKPVSHFQHWYGTR